MSLSLQKYHSLNTYSINYFPVLFHLCLKQIQISANNKKTTISTHSEISRKRKPNSLQYTQMMFQEWR